MYTFKEFRENYITRKNSNYDLRILTDMAVDDNDPSIVVVPILKKLRTYYQYIKVMLSTITPINYRASMASSNEPNLGGRASHREIRNARMNHLLGLPFRDPPYESTPEQEDLSEIVINTLMIRISLTYKYLEDYIRSPNEYNRNFSLNICLQYTKKIIDTRTIIQKNKEKLNENFYKNLIEIIDFFEELKPCLEILHNAFEKSPKDAFQKKPTIDFDYGKPR